MSFGTNNTSKTAENNLGGASNLALNNLFPAVTSAGQGELSTGGENVASGTNFLNSLFGGNAANTGAALQPSVDQLRAGDTNTLNAMNTLMPRGAGRSGTLFSQSFLPNQQIGNLFGQARTQAATALPQIGLQQQGLGANLYGIGNQAIGSSVGANSSLGQQGFQAQNINNNLFSGLGSGLFGLATTPFGGGSATNGLFGMLGRQAP